MTTSGDLAPQPPPWEPRLELQEFFDGGSQSLEFRPAHLVMSIQYIWPRDFKKGPLFHGRYKLPNGSWTQAVSLLYHALTPDGQPETTRRLIVQTAKGVGQHSAEDTPGYYWIGAQIGIVHKTGGVEIYSEPHTLPVQFFSEHSIWMGPTPNRQFWPFRPGSKTTAGLGQLSGRR